MRENTNDKSTGRLKRRLQFLVRLFLWALFTGGNFGCSIGRLVQFIETDELSKLIGCIIHFGIGFWLLFWCKPNVTHDPLGKQTSHSKRALSK